MSLGIKANLAKKLTSFLEKAQEVEQPPAPVTPPPGDPAAAPKPVAPKPVAPKPLPKAPSAKPTKEDMEGEVKGEIEQEQRIKSIDNKLDDLSDALGEKLDEISDVLERGLLPGEKDKKLEEYKDKEDKDTDDEISVDEFGIDPESLVLSKEEPMKEGASLRERRKARLQALSANETLSEEFGLEQDKKERFSPEAPAPKITKVKQDDVPKMFKLSELSLRLRGSSWEILDKDHEVLATVEKKDGIENFASKEYATALVLDMKRMGFEAALEKHGGKKVADSFKEDREIVKKPPMPELKKEDEKKELEVKKEDGKKEDEKKEEEKKDEKKEEKKEDEKKAPVKDDLKLRFARAMKLAFTAMNKNLINGGHNPLKAALFDAFTNTASIDPVVVKALIEESFAKAAEETVSLVLEKTDEHLNMGDEALINYEAAIGDLATQDVSVAKETKASARASELRKAAAEGSLPLTSHVQEDDQESGFDKLQRALASGKVMPNNHGVVKHAALIGKKRRFGF